MHLRLIVCLVLVMSIWSACQPETYRQGEALYKYHCAGCHMDDGSGLARLIPSLDSAMLRYTIASDLICLIRQGLPVDSLTGQKMPPNTMLNGVELANLINFLGLEYHAHAQWVKVTEAEKMYAACQSD